MKICIIDKIGLCYNGNTLEKQGLGGSESAVIYISQELANLVKGEVFRTLHYPHFYYKSAINHKDTISEDVYFCMKAREAGFKVWVDTTIVCDHKGTTLYKVRQDPVFPESEVGVKVIPSNNEMKIFK